jgi:DNA-binding NtrC family response regulator
VDITIQAKLLKLIEARRFRRVGDTRERPADVRIIAATHHHLGRRAHGGLFREELFHRISVLAEDQHMGRAAQRLGIARSTCYQKLRALGIPPRR